MNVNTQVGMFSGPMQGTTLDLSQRQAEVTPMIQQYLQANPNATDYQIFLDAQRQGITPQQIALATNSDLGGIQNRFSQAQQTQQFLTQNPNASPLGMLSAAQSAGFSPQDIQRLSGYSPEEILRVNQPQNPREASMFSSVAKNFLKDEATRMLLMSNPYTAPLGVFYRPVKTLFDGIRKLF